MHMARKVSLFPFFNRQNCGRFSWRVDAFWRLELPQGCELPQILVFELPHFGVAELLQPLTS